jgi:hypothetical protein
MACVPLRQLAIDGSLPRTRQSSSSPFAARLRTISRRGSSGGSSLMTQASGLAMIDSFGLSLDLSFSPPFPLFRVGKVKAVAARSPGS